MGLRFFTVLRRVVVVSGVEADCVEAIFNLGLVNIKLGLLPDAQQAYEKLHTIIPNSPEVRPTTRRQEGRRWCWSVRER